HVRGQVTVVGVLLVNLRHFVRHDAVADGHGDFDGLGVARAAVGILDVGLFGPDAEQGQSLPRGQDGEAFGLDADNATELRDHSTAAGGHPAERPADPQPDQDRHRNDDVADLIVAHDLVTHSLSLAQHADYPT